jgi:hypothetical protein
MDISSPDRLSDDKVWAWFDQNSRYYGLRRPLPGTDPVHIQPLLGPGWHEKAAALRRARLAAAANANRSAGSDVAYPTTAADAGVSPEQWGCVRPKGQETAHSEEKGSHRNVRLAQDKAGHDKAGQDKAGSHHATAEPTETLYKPASAGHIDIKPSAPHPDVKRTPPHADAKPGLPRGEAKPAHADIKPALPHGETKPPQRTDLKAAPQHGEAKPSPPRADTKSAPHHGEAKPPSAQTDKATNRAGTAKGLTGT